MKATYTLLIGLLLGVPACTACGPPDVAGACRQGGRTYRSGETFTTEDGCNACACTADSSIVCTKRACEASCSYEGKRYGVGEEFSAADGCNTCTCAQDGTIHCTQARCPVASSPWLSLEPKQCHQNPWERNASAVNGAADPPAGGYPTGELAVIDRYFRLQGISLKELGLLMLAKPRLVCDACSCPRGDRLVVRPGWKDAEVLSRYGFAAMRLTDALAYEPRQCGNNPWDVTGGAPSEDELQRVLRWADGLGAPLREAGFVYPTERRVACTACSCPRGDRLVVYPENDQAMLALRQIGFTALPTE